MKNKYLLLILGFGLLLRIVFLDKFPPSLNWDEVSHGYNAYSIFRTGRDEWGKLFPVTNFRAYGDYPLPLNLYITIPFIAFLGLSELSIRLPHAILGVLTLLSIYYLVIGVTRNKKLALFATFLGSISPWYIFTSRFVIQSNLSVFFLISGMALFFNREKNKYFLSLSFLSLGLTLFSYHSTRIFTPLLMLTILFIYRHEPIQKLKKLNSVSIPSLLLLIIFFLPLPFILLSPEARARSSVVFLINEGAINRIIESRNSSKLPSNISRLIYSKPVYFAKEFAKNYIGYFSPQFLFLSGGTQYQFSIPNTGLLYIVNLPFFYLGLLVLFKKALSKDKNYQILLFWLILSPIPASITTEKFAVLRSTTMLPMPEILIVLGAFWVFNLAKDKAKSVTILLTALYFIFIFMSLEGYMIKYFTSYTKDYSWAWQYGYKEAISYAKDNYSKYDKIIFTKKYGEPHEYVLFYNAWDPNTYRTDTNLIRFGKSSWFWVDRFDKYNFVNDWNLPYSQNASMINNENFVLESGGNVDCIGKKCLLIVGPEPIPSPWHLLGRINFLDGKTAFQIYEN